MNLSYNNLGKNEENLKVLGDAFKELSIELKELKLNLSDNKLG